MAKDKPKKLGPKLGTKILAKHPVTGEPIEGEMYLPEKRPDDPAYPAHTLLWDEAKAREQAEDGTRARDEGRTKKREERESELESALNSLFKEKPEAKTKWNPVDITMELAANPRHFPSGRQPYGTSYLEAKVREAMTRRTG